jgi:hypothetical protein
MNQNAQFWFIKKNSKTMKTKTIIPENRRPRQRGHQAVRHFLLSAIIFTALPVSAAYTNILDFETVTGAVPFEGMAISNQYTAQFGVSFRSSASYPVLARKGYPQGGFSDGPLGPDTIYDTISSADTNAAAFGDFYLTRDVVHNNTIIMDFVTPVSAAGGFIMDIDGAERATLTAYRDNGTNSVGQIVITTNTPGAGPERAVRWDFVHTTNDIQQIRFVVINAVGPFGLDLLTSSYVPAPSPATNSLRLYPGITIQGGVGRAYQIQFTNRLSSGQWIPLTNFTLPSSPFLFFDTTATNSSERFYKVVGLP